MWLATPAGCEARVVTNNVYGWKCVTCVVPVERGHRRVDEAAGRATSSGSPARA
jgi:hypothetical protein